MTTGPRGDAEQPLLTPKKVIANLATGGLEGTEVDVGREEDRTTERSEMITDALETREIVVVTDEEEEAGITEARAAAVRTYQRWPARPGTSSEGSEDEPPRANPKQRARDNEDSPARSAVGPPRRRRRLILSEEPEEEEEVLFTPIDAQPSSGQPGPPTELEDRERERRERQRKGKAFASPVKKKPRQASTTLVIQDGRQRAEERDEEEDETLRLERRSKRRNDGMRSVPE